MPHVRCVGRSRCSRRPPTFTYYLYDGLPWSRLVGREVEHSSGMPTGCGAAFARGAIATAAARWKHPHPWAAAQSRICRGCTLNFYKVVRQLIWRNGRRNPPLLPTPRGLEATISFRRTGGVTGMRRELTSCYYNTSSLAGQPTLVVSAGNLSSSSLAPPASAFFFPFSFSPWGPATL